MLTESALRILQAGINERHGVCLLELDRAIRSAVDVHFLGASLSIRSLDHG